MIVASHNLLKQKTSIKAHIVTPRRFRVAMWAESANGGKWSNSVQNKQPLFISDLLESVLDELEEMTREAANDGGLVDGGWRVELMR